MLQNVVEVVQHALAVDVENVVGHVRDFALQRGQVEFAEGLWGDHRGKIATRNVHLAARGDFHPGDGELAMGL